jgi:hypothetical protein
MSMMEVLAQFGAASAFAGILATLLWRVILQGREERAEMMKMMQDDNRRNVEALNSLKDVMKDLSFGLKYAVDRDKRKDD